MRDPSLDLEYTELDLFVYYIGRDVVQKAFPICMCQNSIAVIFCITSFFYRPDALVLIGFFDILYRVGVLILFLKRGRDLHTLLCVHI